MAVAVYMSVDQVADIAYATGLRGNDLIVAVAIAKAESGVGAPSGLWANAAAVGDVALEDAKWGPSIGLWQIRSLHADLATGRDRDEQANRASVGHQALAMYHISGGGHSWSPWSTYKNGDYRKYLDTATKAASKRSEQGGTGSISGVELISSTDAATSSPSTSASLGSSLDVLVPVLDLKPNYQPARSMGDLLVARPSVPGKSTFQAAIGPYITGGSVDLSADEVNEVTIDVVNPDMVLGPSAGVATIWNELAWADLRLIIAAVEYGAGDGGPIATLTARDAGVERLRQTNTDAAGKAINLVTPPTGIKNASPSEYASKVTRAVGLRVNAQGSARQADITPTKDDDGIYESEWEVLTRLAGELGFMPPFAAKDVIYFGKPSFLVAHGVEVKVGYRGAWGDRALDAVDFPTVRTSVDDLHGDTIEVLLPRWRGEQVRPGMRLALKGVYGVPQVWLVTGVSWPLDGGIEPVTVRGIEPTDPAPKASKNADPGTATTPSSSSSSSSSSSKSSGTKGAISYSERDTVFGRHGDRSRTTQVTTPWGISVTVNKVIRDRFLDACNAAAAASTWRPHRIDSYADRLIRGSTSSWSLHSYGLAWDFFASGPGVAPPGGVWAETSAPPTDFRNAFAAKGFRLGADYTSRKDYPHIEWAAGAP